MRSVTDQYIVDIAAQVYTASFPVLRAADLFNVDVAALRTAYLHKVDRAALRAQDLFSVALVLRVLDLGAYKFQTTLPTTPRVCT